MDAEDDARARACRSVAQYGGRVFGEEIELDEVEHWVVRCTSARLLDARMDQLRQVLVVSRCVNRGFSGDAQWKALQAKLGAWKTNVRAMIGALAKQRSAGAQLAPP